MNKQDKTPSQKAASNYLKACLKSKHQAENNSMDKAEALFILTTTSWFIAFFASMFLGFHVLCLYLACCMGFVLLGVICSGLLGLAKETIATPLKTLFS
jgi:uncharacterized membrane protein